MTAQESREQFEKWARRCCYDIERAGGGEQYKSNITEQVWLSWQASRAALPAEPVAAQSRFEACGQPWGSCSIEHARMVMAAPSEWKGYEVRFLYAQPVARTPLSDGEILAEQEKLIAAKDELYKSRIGLLCSHCKTGKYRASSNGYNDFHRCDSCRHVPMWGADGKEWGITQEKQG